MKSTVDMDNDVTDAIASLVDGLAIKRRAKTVTGCMDTDSFVDSELLTPDPTSEKFLFRSQNRIRTIYSKVFQIKHVVCLILSFHKNK
jgi:hypothetical protein